MSCDTDKASRCIPGIAYTPLLVHHELIYISCLNHFLYVNGYKHSIITELYRYKFIVLVTLTVLHHNSFQEFILPVNINSVLISQLQIQQHLKHTWVQL
jgi:hypothetical protein